MSNSRPVNNRKASRWFQSRKRSQLRKALRTPVVEQLEDRRLMAAVPYTDGKYYPAIGKMTADIAGGLTAAEYARRSDLTNGGSGGSGSISGDAFSQSQPEGLAGSSLSITEIENNDLPRTAQPIPLGTIGGKFQLINVAGTMTNNANLFDEDYFAVDLRAGDIFDVRVTAAGLQNIPYDVSLNDASGNLVLTRGGPGFPGPTQSPLSIDGTVSFSYVIATDGRYLLRVSGGPSTSYAMRLQAFRNTFEAAQVGTKQIVFVDFDGAIIRGDIFGVPGSFRFSSVPDSITALGLQATDANAIMDETMATIRSRFLGSADLRARNPNFDIDIRDSRTSADPWGLPNVTRLIVGNSTIPVAARGIAQSVDLGNFAREETALVFLNVIYGEVLPVPRGATVTLATALGRGLGMTGSHEIGHVLGAYHQDNASPLIRLMDSGGLPYGPSRLGTGLDGIFGTPDDIDITFGIDAYAPVEGFTGINDTAATVAFALSTGTLGGAITGTTFNDRNRDGIQNNAEEGIGGVFVYADYNSNGVLDSNEPRTTSAANGTYRLMVAPGTAPIRTVAQPNWVLTGSATRSITVGLGQTVSSVNFGQNLPNQTVTGFKWADSNGNGIRDAGEPGLAGVYIYVDLDGDNRIDVGEPQAITIADGSYTLTPPTSGIFAIREVVSPGFIQTFPGGPGALPDQQEHVVNFSSGVPLRGLDFGNQPARDYGDAPAPYATTISQSGASHGFDNNLRLGALLDFEQDGQPNATATGDDIAGVDDEDGVIFIRPIVSGDTQNVFRVNVTNNLSTSSFVSAWVDWNQDGDWTDAGEKVLSDVTGLRGSNDLRFSAPAGVTLGNTFARFRLSGRAGIGPTGFTEVGEVEDYRISVVNELNFAVDDTFTVDRSSTNNILDVQANDFVSSVPGQSATITRIGRVDSSQTSTTSLTTATGAVVTISGANILYTPRAGFQGIDSFTYSIVTSTGATDTATVVVNTVFQRVNPQAIDDSFDLATNDIAIPLNVLANDLQGQGGALTISSFSQPIRVGTGGSAGTIALGQGGLSLRYTPAPGFGGTASFTYTVIDNNGQQSTANVIVHTLEGARLDDQVELSFRFTDLAGTPVTAVAQGQQFKVEVYVDDLRTPNGFQPGVSSAYLDLLYNAGLTRPVAGATGSGFDFAVDFRPPYTGSASGSNEFPGLISSLGASAFVPLNSSAAVPVAVLTFDAINSGIAEFVGDPANDPPQTDVNFFQDATTGVATRVPIEQVRYRRSSLSILPVGTVLPVAVDDGQFLPIPLNSIRNEIRVLANDIVGTNRVPSTTNPGVFVGPEIRITNFGNGRIGTVALDNRGTANPADDVLVYTPNPTIDPNFAGTDQFTYTITDVAGISSTGTVTLQVGNQQNNANALVQLRLETTDLSGAAITQIPVGGQFQLRGYVRDLRTGGANQGVFAAYQDILFDRNLASVNSGPAPLNFAVNFAPQYNQAISGNIRIPGLLDELGSTQTGNDPLGGSERLQFTVTLTANASGTIQFLGDPADVKPFQDSLLYESPGVPVRPLLPSEIRYLRTSITVGGGAGGEGFTNTTNRFDVNNDGFTSPIDVLVIINTLNRSGIRQLTNSAEGEQSDKMFIDVNGDGYVSPLDVLQVINALSARKGSGEGESSTTAPVVTPIVESVASESFETDLDSIVDAVATDIVKRRRV